MIQYAEASGVKYPFTFGMREVWVLSTGQGLEFDDTLRAIHMNVGMFYKLFAMASKKGARRHAENEYQPGPMREKAQSELTLNEQQIEDLCDDDPYFFDQLQEMFTESAAFKKLQENVEKKNKALEEKMKEKSSGLPGTDS